MIRPEIAIIMAVLFLIAVLYAQGNSSRIEVVDGDTIRLAGDFSEDRLVRLVGFNAPERGEHANCARERYLGGRASERLQQLIGTTDIRLEIVPCSCPAGTEGTQACNFGRLCGSMTSAGRDVADILIEEELAVPYLCGKTSCPPLPRPWCEG